MFKTQVIEFFDANIINWFNPKELKTIYKNKIILVTGGGGSIGSELYDVG